MSKEYGYFEAMEEILKDNNKRFKEGKYLVMHCAKDGNIMIINSRSEHSPYINNGWINTKWTLVEDKKSYNVRVYNVEDGRLIGSEIVKMIAEEVEGYCNKKIVFETVENCVYKDKEISFDTKTINKTKVVAEEIVIN